MTNQLNTKRLSNLELAEFCNQMSMILHAGVSSLEGLNILLEDAKSEAEKELLTTMISEMENTGYFYNAALATAVFPEYALHMIKLGEETGTLDNIMEALSVHYTREENLAGMIRSSLFYPCIMIAMMALVIIVLLVKVMPVFQQVFQQLGQEMTGFSAGLLAFGQSLSKYSVAFIVIIAVIILLVIFGRKHLPFQKKLQESMSACRFADGLSIALKSGMTSEQGLDLAANLVENEEYKDRIYKCKEMILEGTSLSEAFQKQRIFSGSYARIAHLADKTGTMDEALAHIAEEYEYTVNNRITNIIAKLEPTLVIVLSVIVGVILFSVMLPLLGIMSGM